MGGQDAAQGKEEGTEATCRLRDMHSQKVSPRRVHQLPSYGLWQGAGRPCILLNDVTFNPVWSSRMRLCHGCKNTHERAHHCFQAQRWCQPAWQCEAPAHMPPAGRWPWHRRASLPRCAPLPQPVLGPALVCWHQLPPNDQGQAVVHVREGSATMVHGDPGMSAAWTRCRTCVYVELHVSMLVLAGKACSCLPIAIHED